jgi:hypothetical protein
VIKRDPSWEEVPAMEDEQSHIRSSYALEDLELIGDPLFVIGVPANFPSRFKKYVFAAAKTYNLGNRSIDYTAEIWRSVEL